MFGPRGASHEDGGLHPMRPRPLAFALLALPLAGCVVIDGELNPPCAKVRAQRPDLVREDGSYRVVCTVKRPAGDRGWTEQRERVARRIDTQRAVQDAI